MTDQSNLLSGLRVIESSLLGPGLIATFFAALGADVIKVEPPSGDYIRQMTWPIVNGVSLLHLRTHRGKKSVAINLKTDDGIALYKELVATADVVIEAMRPGSLAKLGLSYEVLKEINPKIVFATLSGYGATGPYKDLPSHGIAFDTWSGIVQPVEDEQGFKRIPKEMPNIGINVGPMLGAIAVLAGVIKARESGFGCEMELAQADASAYLDWYRIETERAYLRPEDEVTGNASDNYERRPAGLAGMWGGVRYQAYEASDGHILFMASERAFWKNFCEGVGRLDLFERWPGAKFADHARGNTVLQSELTEIFRSKTSVDWIAFGNEHNTPIAPVNTPKTIADDPQFRHRFEWLPAASHGADLLPFPVKFIGESLPTPTKAPEVGEHSDKVLKQILGYADEKVEKLRQSGALG